MRIRRLKREELPADTTRLARFLIGKFLVKGKGRARVSGVIVETEAYLPGDAAAHSYIGITPRNRSLFLERGHSYVYFIYGNWHSINVSSEREGIGAGVLIRSLEPLEGISMMQQRRPHSRQHRLASGPGCLATAMGIDRSLDGIDLCSAGPIWLGVADQGSHRPRIGNSVRIGVTKEVHRKLRFYACGSPSVSGGARLGACNPSEGASPKK
jgi:DNA-3-methyladenine glycosylase